jgi:hypothetical protein
MNFNPAAFWIPSVTIGVLIAVGLADTLLTTATTDQSAVSTIVADQVRSQGFPCEGPSSAERIAAESAPNETAYLLKCEAVTYRVDLIPDQAALVTRIE